MVVHCFTSRSTLDMSVCREFLTKTINTRLNKQSVHVSTVIGYNTDQSQDSRIYTQIVLKICDLVM